MPFAPNDRIKISVEKILRALLGPRLDYLASYPAKAVTQNSDGTLELIADDARIGHAPSVPIRYGVPGVSATVAPGARILLSFAGGDPQKPIATVWESASVTQLVLTASAIKLGGAGATQALVLGTQYATHMGQAVTAANALQAAVTPLMLPPAAAAAKAALVQLIAALTALQGDISTQNKTL